ncbi:unnamed protein product [Didymodactylos carnosus]|uniref:F5/8 type C domain-containing protein n=1 Tax=Didymodactylos carnosus TaxID=1234261 RepID=A0A813XXS5_9BILA|nr:unnamed protein product [Didymodactylos carnosus]CAF0873542.1 unnamed protein product [Didymodactylos carnosus]CAF3502128.1 unnamed protein product [Didymodactylos carnosus]CAF3660760.1 unnamed protein product [Didymodactylos carnosus]
MADLSNIEIKLNETQLSSVLNKDNKNYGKKNLVDGSDETCWNSEAGSTQWIQINLAENVQLSSIAIKFQGGFSAKKLLLQCRLLKNEDEKMVSIAEFYPLDNNKLQIFNLTSSITTNSIRFQFDESYDMFSRIIIYSLKLFQKTTNEIE